MFSEKLINIMNGLRMSNKDLAEKADITLSTVSRLTNRQNDPKYSTIIKISKALKVDPKYFFDDNQNDSEYVRIFATDKAINEIINVNGVHLIVLKSVILKQITVNMTNCIPKKYKPNITIYSINGQVKVILSDKFVFYINTGESFTIDEKSSDIKIILFRNSIVQYTLVGAQLHIDDTVKNIINCTNGK